MCSSIHYINIGIYLHFWFHPITFTTLDTLLLHETKNKHAASLPAGLCVEHRYAKFLDQQLLLDLHVLAVKVPKNAIH